MNEKYFVDQLLQPSKEKKNVIFVKKSNILKRRDPRVRF